MEKFDHRSLLVNLSGQLARCDLKALVYFFKDSVPVSEAELIIAGTDLFNLLEFNSKLGPRNYEHLRQGLLSTGRHDLAQMLPSKFDEHFSRLVVDERSLFRGRKWPEMSRTEAGGCYSMLRTKIALELRGKDLRELVSICRSLGGLSLRNVSSGTELFALLEEKQLLGAHNLEFLSDCLKVIGRDDLSRKLLSLRLFQYLPPIVEGNQHLFLKMRLLSLKQDNFTSKCTWLSLVINGDWAEYSKFTTPLSNRLHAHNEHDVSTLKSLATQLQVTVEDKAERMELLGSTVMNIFDYLELYTNGHLYVHNHELQSLESIQSVTEMLYRCSKHVSQFEEALDRLEWNPEIRSRIRREREDRVTPIGTPAHDACMLIYELCKETFGGEKIEKEIQRIDEMIFRLESGYYLLCYRFLLLQWLLTLVYVLHSLDTMKINQVLIAIVDKNRHQIQTVYPLLVEILGREALQKLLEFSNSSELAYCCTDQPNLSSLDNDFFRSISLPFYAFLFELLAVTVPGGAALGPDEFCQRLRLHQYKLSFTESYRQACVLVTRTMMVAYQKLIVEFRTVVMSANPLCAPLVQEFAQTEAIFSSH